LIESKLTQIKQASKQAAIQTNNQAAIQTNKQTNKQTKGRPVF
jgi:hypothetical protein